MRVSKHTRRAPAVHGIFNSVAVCLFALRTHLLVAIVAVATGNLEARHDSVALLEPFDSRTQVVHDAAEFMAEDISLLQLDDDAVKQVQIGAADGAAGHLEDDIAVFYDL